MGCKQITDKMFSLLKGKCLYTLLSNSSTFQWVFHGYIQYKAVTNIQWLKHARKTHDMLIL